MPLAPEAGAQCGNPARWDLCGGPPARAVPTATRYGNSARQVHTVDSYVHQRLARLTRVKHGLSGRNWVTRFNYAWLSQLGIYRLTGTVRSWSAHA